MKKKKKRIEVDILKRNVAKRLSTLDDDSFVTKI